MAEHVSFWWQSFILFLKKKKVTLLLTYCNIVLLIKTHCSQDIFWKYVYHAFPTFVIKGSSDLTLLTLAPLSIIYII